MFRMSIRANVLSTFLVITGIVACSLLFLQYYFSEKLARESTHRTFTMIANNITSHLEQKRTHTFNILNSKKRHQELLDPITSDPYHPALAGFIQVLEITQDIYALYFANKNGDFYEVINMNNDPYIFKTFLAPKETKWTVVNLVEGKQQYSYLDDKLTLIGQHTVTPKHDPRQRIWYTKALSAKEIINTKPYLYANLQRMGVTYATELKEKGTVLALDYTMTQLNTILSIQDPTHKAEVFLTDKEGNKFASSSFLNTNEKETPALNKALKKHIKTHAHMEKNANHLSQFSHYYYMLRPLPSGNGYLGITLDTDPLLKPYYENLKYSFTVALLLLLFAIPLIIWSSRYIAKPVEDLMKENEKIKNRDFHKVTPIKSHILEFIGLSNSQVSLSQSIQKFEKSQEEILDAIIKLIADAIDAKSPYTGGHCHRVPMIAKALLDEANASQDTAFKDFSFTSKEDLRAFQIGAWLHDCGKVTTPEYVVDKATKLETIYNRIHEIRMRFEVLWRDAHIDYLSDLLTLEAFEARQAQLKDDFAFIASVNIGAEGMSSEDQARIKKIAKIEWKRHFDDRLGLGEVEQHRYENIKEHITLPQTELLLDDKKIHIIPRENFDHEAYKEKGFKLTVPTHLYNYGEVYNLCIEKGTLTQEERYKINEHVIMSIKMLDNIPFPESLSNVVEYAGTHHETLIGTGYPRGLSKKDLSIPARIMAIADIFEALTARDRPYKKAKTLSVTLKIMSGMVTRAHIDADLFQLFLSSGVYLRYAKAHLEEAQIDEVDISQYIHS